MHWTDRLREGAAAFDLRLFEISGTQVTAATLVIFVLVTLMTLWLARLAQRLVVRGFAMRGQKDEGAAAVASRLTRYVVLVVGFSIAVHGVGIDLTALFAAGAVFAVAVGFAMQNIAQNFVSGVILMLERAIKPGDILEVDGRIVRVRDMGIRATVARTLDEEDVIVPNSLLVASTVKNYTLRDTLYRLRATVGVVYDSDMAQVRRVLERTAAKMEWTSKDHGPRVLLADFADSAVVFEISVWIQSPWQMRQRKSELHHAIWDALQAEGIVIAFPQLDVHFEPPVLDAARAIGGATGDDE